MSNIININGIIKSNKKIRLVIGGKGTGKSYELAKLMNNKYHKRYNYFGYDLDINTEKKYIIDMHQYSWLYNINVKEVLEKSNLIKNIIIDNADKYLQGDYRLHNDHNIFLDWIAYKVSSKKNVTLILNSSTLFSKNKILKLLIEKCESKTLLNIPVYRMTDYMKIFNCSADISEKLIQYSSTDINFISNNYSKIEKNELDKEKILIRTCSPFIGLDLETRRGYIKILREKQPNSNIYDLLEKNELIYNVNHQIFEYESPSPGCGYLLRYQFHKDRVYDVEKLLLNNMLVD